MVDPPLETWAREEAMREALRMAKRLPYADYERDVRPRLNRLTREQRQLLATTLECLVETPEA
jgi:hypothetical protein